MALRPPGNGLENRPLRVLAEYRTGTVDLYQVLSVYWCPGITVGVQ